MYIVLLRFGEARARAPEFMSAHNSWLAEGFADGTFLLSGSLKPQGGGAILINGMERAALEARLARDPFVEHRIVTSEIIELAPGKADPRLEFLLSAGA